MNAVFGYFDLYKKAAPAAAGKSIESAIRANLVEPAPAPAEATPSWWKQLLLYLGIVVGVFFSSAIMQFKAHSPISFTFSWPVLIVSMVIGCIIMPVAYDKLAIKPRAIFAVQFSLFVQTGVFWNVLIDAIAKGINQ